MTDRFPLRWLVVLWCALAMTAGQAAWAETSTSPTPAPAPWLTKDNPEELSYSVTLARDSVCGIEYQSVTGLLDNAFIRSRLRNNHRIDQLTLSTTIECTRRGSMLLYYVAVEFARVNEAGVFIRYGERPQFDLRMGTEQELVASIKSLVESALTDYLKANFDL